MPLGIVGKQLVPVSLSLLCYSSTLKGTEHVSVAPSPDSITPPTPQPLKHCDNAEVDQATCTALSASTSLLQTLNIQDNRQTFECLNFFVMCFILFYFFFFFFKLVCFLFRLLQLLIWRTGKQISLTSPRKRLKRSVSCGDFV